jgi:transposase-like protein
MDYTPEEVRKIIMRNYDKTGRIAVRWTALANRKGITPRTLRRYIAQMREDKLIPAAGQSWETVEAKGKKRTLDGIVALRGAKTREERVEILSQIADSGSDISKIQAIKALEDMEAAAGLLIGPPPPTTSEDTIALVLEVLSSVAPEHAKEAWTQYVNTQKSAETKGDSGDPTAEPGTYPSFD